MFHKIYLRVNTELSASDQVLSWIEQLNCPPLPDMITWWQCQMLLQEGFANVVEHAHKDLPRETPIALEAERSSQGIEIRIWSYGAPFDLKQKLQEILEFEDNNGERGRGLKIISALADGLDYKSTADNRSCLWMKKCFNLS